jgi:hypothetical protein
LVVVLEPDHLARLDVLVAALDDVLKSVALDLGRFIACFHQPQGICDDLSLRGVSAFLDLLANKIFETLRDGDVHRILPAGKIAR